MVELVTKFPVKSELNPAYRRMIRSWYPMEAFRRRMDRLFGDYDTGLLPAFGHALFDPALIPDDTKAPLVDVTQSADGYEINAEFPGVAEKDIEVRIVNDGLVIKGVKKEEKQEKEAGYVMSERNFGIFERFFRLPEDVATDKIVAKFANDVLTVTLPKTIEAKKQERTITVKAA